MKKLRVGTSGWAYTSWKPDFYPPKTPSSKFLNFYSTQLNCVEVNYTFRAFPTAKTLQNWIFSSTPDFQFAAKAHQRITHIKRLRDIEQDVSAFYAALQSLSQANKLGPVLFQLPPNMKADIDRLSTLLKCIPKYTGAAIEFRNESWFNDEVYDLMREYNVALCLAESDELQVPDVQTATFVYYRFRRSDYSESEIGQISARLSAMLETRDVYAFLKHEETPKGAINARRLLHSIA